MEMSKMLELWNIQLENENIEKVKRYLRSDNMILFFEKDKELPKYLFLYIIFK